MRNFFTRSSKLFLPAAVFCSLILSTSGVAQTTVVPVTKSTICPGDTVMLAASSAKGTMVTFTWADTSGAMSLTPSMGDTISVYPTKSTSYRVIGDSAGTMDTSYFMVSVNMLPTVKAMVSDSTPCYRDTVMLYGSGAKTYSWSYSNPNSPNFATGDTASFVVERVGEFRLVGTDSNGCKGWDTAKVTMIKAWPSEDVSGFVQGLPIGNSTEVCSDQLFTLKANHGRNNYKWVSNATLSDSTGNQTSLLVIRAISVIVKIDSSNGCSSTLLKSYSPNSVKPALVKNWSTDSIICINDTAMVSVAGGDSYLWSPTNDMVDSNASSGVLFPKVTTAYTVKGIGRGCVTTLNMKVFVNPLPDISLSQSSNGKVLCADEPDTITISSNTGVKFDWGYGVISTDKIKSMLPGKTTTLTITAISAKGCVKPAQITINVDTGCGVRVGIKEAVNNSDINTYIVQGGELHLKFGNVPVGNVDVELINLTGAVAKSFDLGEVLSNNERILNVSELPKGIYLLRVKGEDYEIVNKIMH